MEKASLIINNANVLTLDQQNTRAGSIAVAGDRIIGIWQEPEPPMDAVNLTAETKIIDLGGDTLIPGFIDTHNHILSYAMVQEVVDCRTPPNKSIDEILKALDERVQETPDGEWIQGYGYDDTLLEERRHPTKADLDRISPHHPVLITHTSGHFPLRIPWL